MEYVLERENLLLALKQVERNKGSAGVDGMEVEELRAYLKVHWPEIREKLLRGQYDHQPVKLANLLLDGLDRELERRGHRFVRYADDCNVYVRSRRAGHRVLRSVTDFLWKGLKLKVNESKSAVGRPWERTFLGFQFSKKLNRRISPKALRGFKDRVREISRRTRGRRIDHVVKELRGYLPGWGAYYGFSEVRGVFKELDSWVKRRLRSYLWKQWGRRGYRELRKRGVSRDLAWNTAKSAHGPWRLSRSPALAIALPTKYFASLGLPRLYTKST